MSGLKKYKGNYFFWKSHGVDNAFQLDSNLFWNYALDMPKDCGPIPNPSMGPSPKSS